MNKTEQTITCPVCGKKVAFLKINSHLDKCTEEPKGNREQPTLKTFLSSKRKADEIVIDDVPDNSGVALQSTTSCDCQIQGTDTREHKMRKPEWTRPMANNMDLEIKQLQKVQHLPLSEKLRPKSLNDYIGQQHILNRETGCLYLYIEKGIIPSMILWGPPGVGKTSLARLLTNTVNIQSDASTKYLLLETSATKANTTELRSIFDKSKKEYHLTKRMTVLFIDEIHRFNKAQQDLLLPHIENGDIVLIGATTENPSFQLNNALLSRCQLFVLEKLNDKELKIVLIRAIALLNKYRSLIWKYSAPLKFDEDCFSFIYDTAMGDTRRAINLLELLEISTRFKVEGPISLDKVKGLISSNGELRTYYDTHGENHYDTISAFHKSVRGGDENAALYYLARMLQGGEDPLFIARRMIRIASEDVGLSDPFQLPFSVAAHDAVMKVGLPEAELALAQCAVSLSRASKSVELYRGWNKLKAMLKTNESGAADCPIPLHIRNAPTRMMEELGYGKGYKYNPNFKDGKVLQEYFPQELLDRCGRKELTFLNGKALGDMEDPDLTSHQN
ncbi:ssDNA-dependent ATPase MGS1 [Kluyveromyces lactis]|uniref:KLLA0D19360p n=1 Tax=Kluyveromyces lactis (strain ATCC 8585 / CBS 2359 / DSM 70799 / NBRC 1267 / NRRL Y-1140 / WM37) TaxID=284590 RepID=Q6CQ68_KLULA|nr:uncharacterized protein KLLA0_D19360g [Kluyveromyces lactis]CAH01017.1 KLLA0D19360p [Kluyveromyces lactis]|eukprot:XP_453921.1 uncharacterized protein KLLA0_D19360g [Kluyveromyces lactis]